MKNCEHCGQPSPKGNRFCSILCRNRNNATKGVTHGESRTRLHRIWNGMKARCYIESATGFDKYGERGISVCSEWRESYVAFKEWALANGYSDDLEIDRKDTNGNYEPGNCRWVTRLHNNCNTRKRKDGRLSKFKGVSMDKRSGRWTAQTQAGGKQKWLGSFKSELEAAQAYDTAVTSAVGEHCRTNLGNPVG